MAHLNPSTPLAARQTHPSTPPQQFIAGAVEERQLLGRAVLLALACTETSGVRDTSLSSGGRGGAVGGRGDAGVAALDVVAGFAEELLRSSDRLTLGAVSLILRWLCAHGIASQSDSRTGAISNLAVENVLNSLLPHLTVYLNTLWAALPDYDPRYSYGVTDTKLEDDDKGDVTNGHGDEQEEGSVLFAKLKELDPTVDQADYCDLDGK